MQETKTFENTLSKLAAPFRQKGGFYAGASKRVGQEIRLPKEIRKNAGIEVNETLDVKVSNGVINCL